jgi:MtaA/CmuA family methyltransferase
MSPFYFMNQRQQILDLLSGKKIDSRPLFSGLIHVTAAGLESEGVIFHEVHKDAQKLARAAASTFKLTGFPSAGLPMDLYVEAEALGAEINYRENDQYEFPSVKKVRFGSVKELTAEIPQNTEIIHKGRVKLVCDAVRMVKDDIGNEIVIGAWTPGPFTLMTLLVDPAKLFLEMKREPEMVHNALRQLSSLLSKVGNAYRTAGADFLTVHDMGGSPAFIGPARFEQFVLPALKELIANLPKPRVLSICGNTNASMGLIAQIGAEAISVDQTNDLAASRAALKDTLLFGNLDPVQTLWQGDQAQVTEAVIGAKRSGVDAVWPGCDLVLQTPIENLKAMI